MLDGDRGVSGNPPQEPQSARYEGPAAEGEVLYQEVSAGARQPRRKGGTETGIANMYIYTCESHLRQLIFLMKSDCFGCAVLLCLVVCLMLLASFFLPSLISH